MRASPSSRETTAVTSPRLSVSIARDVHQRERHLDHPLEVLDRDALVGRVDVLHAVRQVEAGEPALVEDVRVRRAAAQSVGGRVTAALERPVSDADDWISSLEAIALVALRHLRLHLTVLEACRKGERIEHLLYELVELAFAVGACLGVERAPLRNGVPRGPALDDPNVRRRLLVDTAEPQ